LAKGDMVVMLANASALFDMLLLGVLLARRAAAPAN